MAEEKVVFADGFVFKLPKDNAPDWVKGNLSIKRTDAIKFLQSQQGDWVNLKVLVAKSGKPYICIDDWKPNQSVGNNQESSYKSNQEAKQEEDDNEPLPF